MDVRCSSGAQRIVRHFYDDFFLVQFHYFVLVHFHYFLLYASCPRRRRYKL